MRLPPLIGSFLMSDELPSTFDAGLRLWLGFIGLGFALTGIDLIFIEDKPRLGIVLVVLALIVLVSGALWTAVSRHLDASIIRLGEEVSRSPLGWAATGAIMAAICGTLLVTEVDQRLFAGHRELFIGMDFLLGCLLSVYFRSRWKSYKNERVLLRDAATTIHEQTQGTLARALADHMDGDPEARTRIIVDGLADHKDPKTGQRVQLRGASPPSKTGASIPHDLPESIRLVPGTNSLAAGPLHNRHRFDDVTVSRKDLNAYIAGLKQLGRHDND